MCNIRPESSTIMKIKFKGVKPLFGHQRSQLSEYILFREKGNKGPSIRKIRNVIKKQSRASGDDGTIFFLKQLSDYLILQVSWGKLCEHYRHRSNRKTRTIKALKKL